jgi:hypothetical protein
LPGSLLEPDETERSQKRSSMLRAMPDPSDVLLDPAASYPVVGELRAAITRRDWTACRAVIDTAPADARTGLIRLGADEPDLEGFLRAVLARDPDDAVAGALLGMHLTDVGWQVRTAARAENVSREQFAGFFEWLRRAEQVLIDSAARTPAEPAVWSARLTSARGLQLGLAETRRRYDRLRVLRPHDYYSQMQMLQSLCPKWSGSWEQLHAWASEEMLAAPPGALQGALVAEAHLEHFLELKGAERTAYLVTEPVRGQLYEAAHRSIWHPEFRPVFGWVRVTSGFAMLFSEIGDQGAAAAAFSMLGPLSAEWPWNYVGRDTTATVRERRARAYATAGGAR